MSQFYAELTILFSDDRFNFTAGYTYYSNRDFNRYFNADCGIPSTFFKVKMKTTELPSQQLNIKRGLRNISHICATFVITVSGRIHARNEYSDMYCE